jgi:predicted Rossmann-fold nucleotide-binding protein
VRGYYDPMLTMLDQMVANGFLKAKNRGLCLDAGSVPDLLDKMLVYEYQAEKKWL